jgi:hypothetical protein
VEQPSHADIVERLAPCGLDCGRCVMCGHGRVKDLATDLGEALEGFEKMAPRVADRVPCLGEYESFAAILAFFSGAECTGCRAGGSQLPFCAARTCFRERGVDFCFQCADYPCERNSYPENLAERWRSYNDRMREVGVERFYQESLKSPRY